MDHAGLFQSTLGGLLLLSGHIMSDSFATPESAAH